MSAIAFDLWKERQGDREFDFCKHCGGTGVKLCDRCDGDGMVDCPWCDVDAPEPDCFHCYGLGEVNCSRCEGDGVMTCPECKGDKTNARQVYRQQYEQERALLLHAWTPKKAEAAP